jgi:hypothetical protein
MLTATTALHRENNVSCSYFANVGLAARHFIGVLFAIKPQQIPEATVVSQQALQPHERAKGIAQLYRMALQYDSVMPSLAAELRCLAARG